MSKVKYQLFSPKITKVQEKRARKWIEALRSGDYKQGDGALRKITEEGERFCCLGVMCDLVPGAKKTWAAPDPEEDDKPNFYFGDSDAMPPEETSISYGLAQENERESVEFQGGSAGPDVLATINDDGLEGKTMTFKGIARLLEQELDATIAAKGGVAA